MMETLPFGVTSVFGRKRIVGVEASLARYVVLEDVLESNVEIRPEHAEDLVNLGGRRRVLVDVHVGEFGEPLQRALMIADMHVSLVPVAQGRSEERRVGKE